MSREVSLGGARLGSGNKLKVNLHGFERSNHDLTETWRSSMAPGTLVPFLHKVLTPGDTFDIDTNIMVLTHPTTGPLYGSFIVQGDFFQIPIRLYIGIINQNPTRLGMNVSQIYMPEMQMGAYWNPAAADIDNSQINPSCILKYLGISGLGRTENGLAGNVARAFNAVTLMGYWDIYKQYYANKQEEVGYVIHYEPVAVVNTVNTITTINPTGTVAIDPLLTSIEITRSTNIRLNYVGAEPKPEQIMLLTTNGWVPATDIFSTWSTGATPKTGTGVKVNTADPGFFIRSWRYLSATDPQDREPKLVEFPLQNIDDERQNCIRNDGVGTKHVLQSTSDAPYGLVFTAINGYFSKMSAQEGLGVKTYQSDLLNNWLNEEWIDGATGVNEVSAIAVVDDKVTVDAINLANKVYNLLNRIAVSDGSYQAYIGAAYDHDMYGLPTMPIYEGGIRKELEFQEVVSTAGGEGGTEPLGTLAGKGVMGSKHKGGRLTVNVNELGWLMGIVSITPRIDYSQGNDWDINLKTIADFHVPNLDGIGFQDLNAEQAHWAETTTNITGNVITFKSIGKQPAWINYMTSINKTFGSFAIKGDEMFMTLNRNYSVDGTGITDVTTYIDPVKYNQIFAYTKRDSMNFWVQIRTGITARRKMSAKVMPNM